MKQDLFDFIRSKIADVEKSIDCREDSERAWRGGTDASWRQVGCKMNKAERIALADREARIIVKLLIEAAMFKKVLEAISK